MDSTNRLARERAATAPDGSLVVAEAQRGGRGRGDRRWFSPPDAGLWMSILRRVPLPAARGGLVPLAAGSAVAEALERTHAVSVGIEWPNDIVAGGRKLGGVLVESATAGDVLAWVVVGIGLNLLAPIAEVPAEVAERAITLEALGVREVDRHALLLAIHEEVMAATAALETGDGQRVCEAFAARDTLRDRRVSVTTQHGGAVFGTARGIDPDGALIVEVEGERLSVRSGTVRPA